MEDFIDDCYSEPAETDEEYEFEACQFFDFTRPELDSEIEEAERWFEVSGDYPPSPFIVNLNLEKLLSVEVVPNSSKAKYSNSTKSISSNSDTDTRHGVSSSKKSSKGKSYLMPQDNAKAKTKSPDKLFQPRNSTLMEPTASHLAKQHKVHEKHSSHLCTRFQKTLQSPTRLDNVATKRQKLETGYLRKVAHLKHQFSLLHKSSKKVTIPREPELETQLRAQRRRSKNSCASSETGKQKQNTCNFKAHPLNRKILQASSLPQLRKSTPQLPQFQVFCLKTMERANHHASAKVYPSATDTDIVQDGKQKSAILTESGLSSDNMLLESPPIQQFTKLSLGSEIKTSNVSQLNRHTSAKTFHAKPNQCGDRHTRVSEAKQWSYMTRSLDIR